MRNVALSWWYLRKIGILLHVFQRVVHPAHVPLVAKAQPAEIDRPRDHRPGGRFFGDHHRVGIVPVDLLVERAEELDRFQVLPPAGAVGQPLARRAGVVEIEHRGHGVGPQAVDVILVEPEEAQL